MLTSMRRAFTLIELLVVIAIIAILAAILFPVFSRAKDAAKATAGIAQMRQLAAGVMMYAGDYDDYPVPSTNYDAPISDPNRIWTVPILPYLKNKEILIAPGANTSQYATDWNTRQRQSVGYNDVMAISSLVGNTADRICNDGEVRFGCSAFWNAASFGQMEETARIGLFANTPHGNGGKYRGFVFGADNGTVYRPDYTSFTSLDQAVPLASGEDLVQVMGNAPLNLQASELKPIIGRYNRAGKDGRTPVVFADGHTKSVLASQIANGSSGIIWRFR
jgi:prepilin-type N-terminal cleavage/methylation domain-containing protein